MTASVASLIVASMAFGGDAERPDARTADQILEPMRANDAQFDNVLLACEYMDYRLPVRPPARRRGGPDHAVPSVLRVDADPDVDMSGAPEPAVLARLAAQSDPEMYRKVTGQSAPPVPPELRKWAELIVARKVRVSRTSREGGQEPAARASPVVDHSEMKVALRWPDIVVERTPKDASALSPGEDTYSKWRSIGQTLEQMTAARVRRNHDAREWIVTKKTVPLSLGPQQELGLWLKFALGVGYADYISEVQALKPAPGGTEISCDLSIWDGKLTPARLVVDADGIVREADIKASVTTLTVRTSGLFKAGTRFVSAESGSFVRRFNESEKWAPKFDVKLTEVKFDLSDAEFLQFADLAPPDGEPVARIDLDAGGPAGAMTAPGEGAASPLRTLLIILNIALIVAITAALMFRRLRRRGG